MAHMCYIYRYIQLDYKQKCKKRNKDRKYILRFIIYIWYLNKEYNNLNPVCHIEWKITWKFNRELIYSFKVYWFV